MNEHRFHETTDLKNDRRWAYDYYEWVAKTLSLSKLKEKPILLPVSDDFPYTLSGKKEDVLPVIKLIAERFEFDFENVSIRYLERGQYNAWKIMKEPKVEEHSVDIYILEEVFEQLIPLIVTASYEFAFNKFALAKVIFSDEIEEELASEFTASMYGFGLFFLLNNQQNEFYARRNTFLKSSMHLHCLAITTSICQVNEKTLKPFLNSSLFDFLISEKTHLQFTEEGHELIEKINTAMDSQRLWEKHHEFYETQQYPQAIEYLHQLIQLYPKNTILLNGLGYTHIMNNNACGHEAIEAFTKATDIDPYFDFPFNNRGYCFLLKGELEQAHTDLESALHLSNENSFTHRNLGIYYLKIGNYPLANKFLKKALELDPKTELIHFCLGALYSLTEEKNKAIQHFDLSRQLNEHHGRKELAAFFGIAED